jgi:NAD(P)H-flavin reductase
MNASARVAAVHPDGPGLVQLTLEVAPQIEASFRVPGQYQELALPGHPGKPFAIASAPGTGRRFVYLVRLGFPLADALAALPPGAPVELSPALGPGFPLEVARGRDLLLLATGTGSAPMRSVIETVARERRAFRQLTFYFGGRHGKDFAFEREWPRWASLDVELVRTVSEDDPAWAGRRGFVQAHLKDADFPAAAAFVVGSNPMVQAVTAELVRRGMRRERVFLNL